WYYNDLSMGVPENFNRAPGLNVLLIGDSIVNGGNPFRQVDRLGPVLQSKINGKVWPVSAGSWGLINEMRWLERHPDVVNEMSVIIIVSNSADFGRPSVWQSDVATPRNKPSSALWYTVRRYVFSQSAQSLPNDITESTHEWDKEWK